MLIQNGLTAVDAITILDTVKCPELLAAMYLLDFGSKWGDFTVVLARG